MKLPAILAAAIMLLGVPCHAASKDTCELMNMLAEETWTVHAMYKGKKYHVTDGREMMRIFLQFYDKNSMIHKIDLEEALLRDIDICLKNKMMRQFQFSESKNKKAREYAYRMSAYAFDHFVNQKKKLTAKYKPIQDQLIDVSHRCFNLGESPTQEDITLLRKLANSQMYGRLTDNAEYILNVLQFVDKTWGAIERDCETLEICANAEAAPHSFERSKKRLQTVYKNMLQYNDAFQKIATFQLEPEKYYQFFVNVFMLVESIDEKFFKMNELTQKTRELYGL